MLPDQLLRESWRLQCQAFACQQLGLEGALKAKTKAEEELLSVKDQLSVLKVERDSALECLPLKEKADSLAQRLSQKEPSWIRTSRCTEWKSLSTEAQEMCQETLEIVLDEVSHLCPGVDFSAITLRTHWDLKGRRTHVPEELLGDGAEVAETLPEVVPEQQ
ncbi:hypothetical protein PIB30_040011 [Stylosanthes scabra]|uniref:Uncharacterized protein n=1 Tax=Stylosanthes scabra TaxID=79078 RepID=A0ABU6ZD58_9FABA|nr:hypothetical protein [Stylosanthes scabra]